MRKIDWWIFLIFTAISLGLYFSRYPQLATFDADQEFFARQYVEIFLQHKPTLIGIQTSVGGMFVGPLYTYLTAAIYYLFGGHPKGMQIFTLILASLQPGLTYLVFSRITDKSKILTQKNSGVLLGIFGAILVTGSFFLWTKAFSPSPINLLYLAGLGFFLTLSQLNKNKNYLYLLAVILGLATHIHFSLLIFFLIFVIWLIWQKIYKNFFIKDYLISCGIIAIFLSPLVIFDFRHQHLILNNLMSFASSSTGMGNIFMHMFSALKNILNVFIYFLNPNPGWWVNLLFIVLLIYLLKYFRLDRNYQLAILIFAVALPFFIWYRGPLPDYYLYFLITPFLYAVAGFSVYLFQNTFFRPLLLILFFILLMRNFQQMTVLKNPYNLFIKYQAVEYLKNQTQNRPVKVYMDTDLGLQFGFGYLLDYLQVRQTEDASGEIYQIVLRENDKKTGMEFKLPGVIRGVKIVRIK